MMIGIPLHRRLWRIRNRDAASGGPRQIQIQQGEVGRPPGIVRIDALDIAKRRLAVLHDNQFHVRSPCFSRARRTRNTSPGLSSASRIVIGELIISDFRPLQREEERGTLAGLRFDPNAPTGTLDDLLAKSKPDPRAFKGGPVQPFEDPEDLRADTRARCRSRYR